MGGTSNIRKMRLGKITNLPWKHGFVAGTAVFVLGSLVAYIIASQLIAGSSVRNPGRLIFRDNPFKLTVLFYLFFHWWPVLFNPEMVRILFFSLIPITMLVTAGYLIALRFEPANKLDGFAEGATVVSGYFVFTIVSFFVLFDTLTTDVVATIGFVTAVLFTGVVFPIAFGGLGGVIAYLVLENEELGVEDPG